MADGRAPDAGRAAAGPAQPLPARALTALREGRTLDALQALRELEGLDLRRAQARADAYLATDPALKKRLDERRRDSRKRLIGWVLVVDAVILASLAAWWFSR